MTQPGFRAIGCSPNPDQLSHPFSHRRKGNALRAPVSERLRMDQCKSIPTASKTAQSWQLPGNGVGAGDACLTADVQYSHCIVLLIVVIV